MTVITMLGLDPSLSATGWAIADVDVQACAIVKVHEVGLVTTKPNEGGRNVRRSADDMIRTRKIVAAMRKVHAAYQIRIACAEVPFGAQSARAALSNGVCVGVMASLPYPLFEVSPSEVKMASVGQKHADKEDIIRWAIPLAGPGMNWPINTRKNDWAIPYAGKFIIKEAEHPADALAAIAAGIQTPQFTQLAGMLASLHA